jgi:hypothetical protein
VKEVEDILGSALVGGFLLKFRIRNFVLNFDIVSLIIMGNLLSGAPLYTYERGVVLDHGRCTCIASLWDVDLPYTYIISKAMMWYHYASIGHSSAR